MFSSEVENKEIVPSSRTNLLGSSSDRRGSPDHYKERVWIAGTERASASVLSEPAAAVHS